MSNIAVGEQEQAAGAIENKSAIQPYPPSWLDRLLDWVQRLPGPAWLYFLGVALVLAPIRTIAAWSDGSYPVGTFFPTHILIASTSAYLVFVVHYLDNGADAALNAFRPVLNADDAGYERLRYQLTTMPARPVLAWSIAGLIFGLVGPFLLLPEAQFRLLKLYTSPATALLDCTIFALQWMITLVSVYHIVHQLQLVSRIYTHYTNINIFETGPLYALSRVTAMSTVFIIIGIYLYLTYWIDWQTGSAADAVVAVALILIAFVTFVWPLLGAHRLLRDEKTRWKGEIARRMKAVADKLHHRVDTDDMEGMGALKDALDGLIAERGVVDKVSTWPWEPETLRVMGTALLLPVVIWVVTRVLERLGF